MARSMASAVGARLGALWLLGVTAACPDCAPGSGTLDFTCDSDEDCTLGYVCHQGLCVRAGATVDAGSTMLDARAVDLLAADAVGADAAIADTPVEDAAVADVPVEDAVIGMDAATCAPDVGGSPWTLLSAMTRRAVDGPFGVAALVQGPVTDDVCAAGDGIGVARGDYLDRSFYDHFDPTQGSLVVWITPEWDAADIADDARTLLAAGDVAVGIAGTRQGIWVQLGASRQVFDSAISTWVAGSTHLLVLRWDQQHDLGGGQVALNVDGVEVGAQGSGFIVSEVADPLLLGVADVDGRGSIGGLLEGLTLYRRPLRHAGSGVDVGVADEVAAIHAAGAGREPPLVTGSWDVVLAMPGDAEEGALPASGQAFSHPHGDNLLGSPGYLLSETARQAWSATAPGVVASAGATPVNWIYAGATRVTTTQVGEGIQRTATAAASASLVVRALVHSDGTAMPLLQLEDDGGTLLTHVNGSASSTREHPDVLMVTLPVPASPGTVHVKLLNRSNQESAFFVHQVEVLPNLLRNPSFEEGSDVDPAWQPTGWTNQNTSALRTYKEQGTVHTGATAVAFEGVGTSGYHDLRTLNDIPGFNQLGHFFGVGAFFHLSSGVAPGIRPDNGCLMRLAAPVDKAWIPGSAQATGTWQHVRGVGRRHDVYTDGGVNCQNDLLRFGGNWGATLRAILDDAYVVHLEQVAVTPLPADLARSLESGMVRADGEDSLSMPIATLTATSGQIALALGLDHPVALYQEFCPYDAVLWQAWADADNHITLRFNYDSSMHHGIRIDADFGGQHFDYVVLDIDLDGRVARAIELRYQTGGRIQLRVDGNLELDQPMDTREFTVVPHTLYAGASAGGWPYCDLRVDVDGAAFSLP